MILVFSREEDFSTTQVYKWLLYHFKRDDVVRINSNNESITKISIRNDTEIRIFYGDSWLDITKNIKSVWHRKGGSRINIQLEPDIKNNSPLKEELSRLAKLDKKRVIEYINFKILKNCNNLGNSSKGDLNKLICLDVASSNGLNTVDSFISNSKSEIDKYFSYRAGDKITKSISDGLYLFDTDNNQVGYFNYTEKVKSTALSEHDSLMALSLVQQEIKKKYEIRTFYLNGKFYSSAIFSQCNPKTSVDFRKYSRSKPSRNVPYNLPTSIEKKLKKIFLELGLNTGSVDLIVSTSDEYYFLEINPVGQFAKLAKVCNYPLEKLIAEELL